MCIEICDGAGAGICDGVPSTCSSLIIQLAIYDYAKSVISYLS